MASSGTEHCCKWMLKCFASTFIALAQPINNDVSKPARITVTVLAISTIA